MESTTMNITPATTPEAIRQQIAELSVLAVEMESKREAGSLLVTLKPLYAELKQKHSELSVSTEQQIDAVAGLGLSIERLGQALESAEVEA